MVDTVDWRFRSTGVSGVRFPGAVKNFSTFQIYRGRGNGDVVTFHGGKFTKKSIQHEKFLLFLKKSILDFRNVPFTKINRCFGSSPWRCWYRFGLRIKSSAFQVPTAERLFPLFFSTSFSSLAASEMVFFFF